MTDKRVLYRHEDGIGWLTLNRPQSLNALDGDLLRELLRAVQAAQEDPEVEALILTGAGDRAFSAGADIAYLHVASPLEVRELAALAVRVTHALETSARPVLAALNGVALGGGLELAEACTLRLAASHSRLGHPEVRIGAIAGWGGTTRLARLIGRGRAQELLLTGETLSAEQALGLGLVNRVVEPEELSAAAAELARKITANSPIAVRLTREALHRGLDMGLEESTRLGVDCFGLVAASEDFREGTRAFLEKRRPVFSGR